MKPATATIDDLRRAYGDLLRRVEPGGERIVITRRGRPIAALIPLSDLDRLEGPMSEDRATYSADTASVLSEVLDDLMRQDTAGYVAASAFVMEGLDKQAAIRALAEAILKVQALP